MKAARLHAYGQGLVIEDVSTPSPDRGQVLIKIEGARLLPRDERAPRRLRHYDGRAVK